MHFSYNLLFQSSNLLVLGNDNSENGICAFNEAPQFVFSHRKVGGRRKASSRSTPIRWTVQRTAGPRPPAAEPDLSDSGLTTFSGSLAALGQGRTWY